MHVLTSYQEAAISTFFAKKIETCNVDQLVLKVLSLTAFVRKGFKDKVDGDRFKICSKKSFSTKNMQKPRSE